MMMLSSGNCLRLSIVILLTPQEELFRAPRMECKPARHPCSICQPVGSQSCIRYMIYWSHVRDNGMPELVNGHTKVGTQRVMYRRTTKCHHLQGLFSWHCKSCTILCYVAFVNAVYKPSYSTKSCGFHSY